MVLLEALVKLYSGASLAWVSPFGYAFLMLAVTD